MSTDPRPDDASEPQSPDAVDDDLFADLPAFDVIDGELMPRAPRSG
ncbi:MAG: hypothetical protein PGN24_01620 [Microbacterium arborescens]